MAEEFNEMNWLNIHTAVLDSPEFIGSDPTERATWLCLLRYCAGQENGGRLTGCREWKDRQWQQLIRVTQQEAFAECELWQWDGDDLIVAHYPLDKESEIKTKREVASVNGKKGGRPPKQSEEKPTSVKSEKPTSVKSEKPTSVISAKAEGERKGKEIERNENENENEKEAAAGDGDGGGSDSMFPETDPPHKRIKWNVTDGFTGIQGADKERWAKAFPACNADLQISQADLWLRANPAESKKSNFFKFLTGWLQRTQDRGGDIRNDRKNGTNGSSRHKGAAKLDW